MPLYFPDEFKRHFRMTKQTHELFNRPFMHTLQLPYTYFRSILKSSLWRLHCNNIEVRDLRRVSDRNMTSTGIEKLAAPMLGSISGLEEALARARMV